MTNQPDGSFIRNPFALAAPSPAATPYVACDPKLPCGGRGTPGQGGLCQCLPGYWGSGCQHGDELRSTSCSYSDSAAATEPLPPGDAATPEGGWKGWTPTKVTGLTRKLAPADSHANTHLCCGHPAKRQPDGSWACDCAPGFRGTKTCDDPQVGNLCTKNQCGEYFNTAKFAGNLLNACGAGEADCTDRWTQCKDRKVEGTACTYTGDGGTAEPTSMGPGAGPFSVLPGTLCRQYSKQGKKVAGIGDECNDCGCYWSDGQSTHCGDYKADVGSAGTPSNAVADNSFDACSCPSLYADGKAGMGYGTKDDPKSPLELAFCNKGRQPKCNWSSDDGCATF